MTVKRKTYRAGASEERWLMKKKVRRLVAAATDFLKYVETRVQRNKKRSGGL